MGRVREDVMNDDLNLLLIEDNPDDAELIRAHLDECPGIVCTHVSRLADAKRVIRETSFSAALLDLSLPDSKGLVTVGEFLEHAGALPVVVMTGLDDDKTALSAVRLGAQDYLVKDVINGELLTRVIRHAIQRKEIIVELQRYRTQLEDMVRERTNRLHEKNRELELEIEERRAVEYRCSRLTTAISAAADGVVVMTREGLIEYVNEAFERISGYTSAVARGASISLIDSEEYGAELFSRVVEPLKEGDRWENVLTCSGRTGGTYHAHVMISPVTGAHGGQVTGYVCILRDVTELRQLQQELQLSQRMEAIGQLAGGVAHDFNNILQVILGLVEMIHDAAEDAGMDTELLKEVDDVARRGVTMTRQLMAFGRRQHLSRRAILLRDVVTGLETMLDRLLGSKIAIETTLHDSCPVHADPAQMEQVIMNLCINARDAMSEGGKILIKTEFVSLDQSYCSAYTWATPGDYVLLEVSDTGCGISPEVISRVFEPFFTTKGVHEGNGLGLATVYGIVKQHSGFVHCYSELDVGTTFRIYLPVSTEALRSTKSMFPVRAQSVEADRLLLVEDNRIALEFARRSLEEAGYTVLVATNGLEALEVLQNAAPDLGMVITDVVMPHCSGVDLVSEMKSQGYNLNVLMTTGFATELVESEVLHESHVDLLEKPYSKEQLLTAVHGVLNRAPSGE